MMECLSKISWRQIVRLSALLTVLFFASCRQATDESAAAIIVNPFELTLINSNYAAAYNIKYKLTDKDLSIIFSGELDGETDSTLFKKALKPDTILSRLSNIQIDSLQEYYSNICVRDGSQIRVELSKNNKSKTIQLSNYYQADIGRAIELINVMVPKQYKIWYDKAELTKDLENCN